MIGGLLPDADGTLHLRGWQWVFIMTALLDRWVAAIALFHISLPLGAYGLSYWLPTVVKGFGVANTGGVAIFGVQRSPQRDESGSKIRGGEPRPRS